MLASCSFSALLLSVDPSAEMFAEDCCLAAADSAREGFANLFAQSL